jgi:hypothetical protein
MPATEKTLKPTHRQTFNQALFVDLNTDLADIKEDLANGCWRNEKRTRHRQLLVM